MTFPPPQPDQPDPEDVGRLRYLQPDDSQPPYGQPHYQPPSSARAPAAPPLQPGQKRGAFWAGLVSLNLINFGGSLLLASVFFGLILAFVTAIIRASSSDGTVGTLDPETREFLNTVEGFDPTLWIIGAALLGVLILVLGVFSSYWILSACRVARPWAVTWSSIGISIPVLLLLSFASSVVSQFVATLAFASAIAETDGSLPDFVATGLGTGIVLTALGFIVSIALVGVVGWLIWWWMAHAFRARTTPAVE